MRSWMLRAVANHAKNHVRSRIRRIRREDHHARLLVRVEDGTEQAAIQRLENLVVAEALGRLQLHDREVLGCRFVAELSEAETAEVLDVPVGTVKSRTSRAPTARTQTWASTESRHSLMRVPGLVIDDPR